VEDDPDEVSCDRCYSRDRPILAHDLGALYNISDESAVTNSVASTKGHNTKIEGVLDLMILVPGSDAK
jgi:hypothetical protein